VQPPGFPEKSLHAAIAGASGGYIVWGRYSSVNYQILLYLSSRVLIGIMSLAREKQIPPFCWDRCNFEDIYPLKAAVTWGVVMYLFEKYPYVLHSSLKRSMDEVYRMKNIV